MWPGWAGGPGSSHGVGTTPVLQDPSRTEWYHQPPKSPSQSPSPNSWLPPCPISPPCPWLPPRVSVQGQSRGRRVRLLQAQPFTSPFLVQWPFYLHCVPHRVLGCMPFITVAYFFLWFLPPFTSLRGLWYMTFYCLFQALATVSRWPPLPGPGPLESSHWPVATLKCVCQG